MPGWSRLTKHRNRWESYDPGHIGTALLWGQGHPTMKDPTIREETWSSPADRAGTDTLRLPWSTSFQGQYFECHDIYQVPQLKRSWKSYQQYILNSWICWDSWISYFGGGWWSHLSFQPALKWGYIMIVFDFVLQWSSATSLEWMTREKDCSSWLMKLTWMKNLSLKDPSFRSKLMSPCNRNRTWDEIK